ncbi:MAG: hypothetical protein NUV35_05350, partial [Syntrophomonadaceae bacterium]|nr:hypothetical protein [Syntrophomonadaceae bacterium]
MLSWVYRFYSEYSDFDEVLASLVCIVGLSLAVNMGLSFLLRQFAVPRTVFAMASVFQLLLLGVWRTLVWRKALLAGAPKKAVIVGAEGEIERLRHAVADQLGRVFFVADSVSLTGEGDSHALWDRLAETSSSLREVAAVIVGAGLDSGTREAIVEYCVQTRKSVLIQPRVQDIMLQRAGLVNAGDVPLLLLQGISGPGYLSW